MAAFAENAGDGLTLTLGDVDAGDDALTFEYDVVNGTDARAYLVNRLFHRGADGFRPDADLVYAAVGDDGRLQLRKHLIDVPEDLDVEAPEVPYVTPLEARASFSERVRVAVPVRPHDPYRRQREADEPRVAQAWSFVLGYVLEEESLRPEEVELPSGGTAWRLDYADVRRGQLLKSVEDSSAIETTIAGG